MNAKSTIFRPPVPISLLAPLAWVYAAGISLHRRLGFRSGLKTRDHLIPLIVVGGLRSGGSGKTPVARGLARILAQEGMRVGILAYRLGGRRPGWDEVFPDSDWRASSDEAILSARDGTARIFVTRDREAAWDALSREGDLNVLISDDGLMDPRLESGTLRLVLRSPEEKPGPGDFFPAGPFHPVRIRSADCLVEGPLPAPPVTDPGGLWFSRELVLPANPVSGPCIAIGGMGHPGRFVGDLRAAGFKVAGMVMGPDHGLPPPARIRRWRERRGQLPAVCSEKDWVKLAGRGEYGPVAVVGERIRLGEGILRAVRGYLQTRSTS